MKLVYALVESPLQFLSALESAAADETMFVLVRPDAPSMDGFLAAFDPAWLPDHTYVRRASPHPGLFTDPMVDAVLIGDICSGAVHRALFMAGTSIPPPLRILDDGLDTLTAIKKLSSGKILKRPKQKLSTTRQALSATVTTLLRRQLDREHIEWTTAMPVDDELKAKFRKAGGRIVRHDFPRVRQMPITRPQVSKTIVLGSAFPVDGLIDDRPYRAWLQAIAANAGHSGPISYFPHRRETSDFLAQLPSLGPFTVVQTGLPVELTLVGVGKKHTIHSLPTTAALSLPLLNPHAQFITTPIPEDWWTEAAGPDVRELANRFAA